MAMLEMGVHWEMRHFVLHEPRAPCDRRERHDGEALSSCRKGEQSMIRFNNDRHGDRERDASASRDGTGNGAPVFTDAITFAVGDRTRASISVCCSSQASTRLRRTSGTG